MPDLNLNVSFDYENNITEANLVSLYPLNTSLSSASNLIFHVKVHDADGTVIQSFLSRSGQPNSYMNNFMGSGAFGLSFTGQPAGIDTSILRTDNSGAYAGIWSSNWELSEDPALAIFKTILATGVEGLLGQSRFLSLDRRDNTYLNTPLLITDGDAVTYGVVSTVQNHNLVSLSLSDYALSSYTGQNLNDCIGQIVNAEGDGDYFRVIGLSGSSSGFYVDRKFTSYSGETVKLMPYRTVTSYSGWDYSSGGNGNKGGGGIAGRFGLSSNIPTRVGSLYYTSGYHSGTTLVTHPDYNVTDIIPATVVTLFEDPDYRNINIGDIVYYNPASNLGATSTGVVVRKGTYTNGEGENNGDIAITYWPSGEPHADSTYTIYRNNQVKLQCFPKLNRQYLVTAQPTDVTITGEYTAMVSTPSVTLDFSANEYPSTFATISEKSHFHIGPIYLSNGQMLDDKNLGQAGYLPLLQFSGAVYNGDPIYPTTVVEKTMMSTQNADVAHLFSGSYVKNGIATMAAATAFNASETLICKAVINYGDIKIDRVFTIPVQPTI